MPRSSRTWQNDLEIKNRLNVKNAMKYIGKLSWVGISNL